MYVSTLRNFIQAMGGQLQVKAIFPEGEIQIDQFENVAEPQARPLAKQAIQQVAAEIRAER